MPSRPKPVMISSKISRMSCRSQYSRSSWKNSGGGTTKPADETEIGSMMIAATVSGSSATIVLLDDLGAGVAAALLGHLAVRAAVAVRRVDVEEARSSGSKTDLRSQPPPADSAPIVAPW